MATKKEAAKELLRRRKIKAFEENIKKYNSLSTDEVSELLKFIENKSKEIILLHNEQPTDKFIKGQVDTLYDISCYVSEIITGLNDKE